MVLSRKKLAQKKRVEKALEAQLLDNSNSDVAATAEHNGKTEPHTPSSENKSENRKPKLALKKKQKKEALKEKRRKKKQNTESGEEDKLHNEKEQHQQQNEQQQHHKTEGTQNDSKNVSDCDELEMNLVSSEPKASKENTLKSKKRKRKDKNSNHDMATNHDTNTEQQDSAKDHDSTDTTTVYVGGIPYYSSEDDIRDFFRECGTICNVNCKTFPDSGKFRGIALLTFKTEEAAKRALGYDGSNMGNQFLKVMPSLSKHKEAPKKEGYSEAPSKTEGYTRAYIGNLSWDITEENIREFFKDCKIDAIRFSMDKATGEFLGFGHVDFADDQSLEQAVKLDQELVLGRPIKVAYALRKKKEQTEQTPSSGKKTNIKDKSCYSCGLKGHISAYCVNKVKET